MDDGLRHLALQEVAKGGGDLGVRSDSELGQELGDWGQDVVCSRGPAAARVVNREIECGQAGFEEEMLLAETVMSGLQPGNREIVGSTDHGDAADEPSDPKPEECVALVEKWASLLEND